MNPKIDPAKKARSAGISLDPEIKEKAKALAKERGFKGLSAFAHKLLSDALAEAAQEAEAKGEAKIKEAKRKISAARSKK